MTGDHGECTESSFDVLHCCLDCFVFKVIVSNRESTKYYYKQNNNNKENKDYYDMHE